jgi:hypothetical protein
MTQMIMIMITITTITCNTNRPINRRMSNNIKSVTNNQPNTAIIIAITTIVVMNDINALITVYFLMRL